CLGLLAEQNGIFWSAGFQDRVASRLKDPTSKGSNRHFVLDDQDGFGPARSIVKIRWHGFPLAFRDSAREIHFERSSFARLAVYVNAAAALPDDTVDRC